MRFILTTVFLCLLVPIIFLIVFTPEPCEHEDTLLRYSFVSEDVVESSSVARFCKDCGKRVTYYSLFKGTLVDQSYLAALQEHSDGGEIVPGEYYTVSATVPQGFVGGGSNALWLNCRVENEDFILSFPINFREEFGDQVRLIQEGEEITFRGRFNDVGCGFSDCELITE